MKLFKILGHLFAYGTASFSLFAAPSDIIDDIINDPDQCYYWTAIHHDEFFNIETDELLRLVNKQAQANLDRITDYSSFRKRAVTLLAARVNRMPLSPEMLTGWISSLKGTSGGQTDEDNLIHEIVMALGMQNENGNEELQSLLNSENQPIREAAYSAILFYADENVLTRMLQDVKARESELKTMVKHIIAVNQSDPTLGAQLAEQLSEKSQFAPHAINELKDYFAFQAYDLSDQDWLRMLRDSYLINVRSTSANVYSQGTGYLTESLTNRLLLKKLDEILSKASDPSERKKLEQVFRNAVASQETETYGYYTPFFYLLGFELTKEEKAFLMNVSGLSEDQFLSRGQIHLIGYGGGASNGSSRVSESTSITPIEKNFTPSTIHSAINEPAEATPVETIKEAPEECSNWFLWLIGALVILGGLFLVVRRKS